MKIALDLRKASPANDATLGAIAAEQGKFDEAIACKKALEDRPYAEAEGAIATIEGLRTEEAIARVKHGARTVALPLMDVAESR